MKSKPWHVRPSVPGSLVLAFVVAACAARQPVDTPATSVVLDPPAERNGGRAPGGDGGLPALQIQQLAGVHDDEDRIDEFRAADEDLRLVLRELAHGFGLEYRLAPEVSGRVSIRLQDVTLEEAVREIVRPHGFDYRLQDRVLYVGPPQVESRLFTLDYVALGRVGHSSTVIQRRLGTTRGNQFGGGQFGGQAGAGQSQPGSLGTDVISSSSVADMWNEIRVALEAIVFADADPDRQDPGQAGRNNWVATAPSAWSRVDDLGRRLVINPMAGSILVHAPRGTLLEIEDFLRVFEASVQRQVLIEAKIVEVRLSRSHEFGIDWSAVQRIGSLELRAGTEPAGGGLQFTLDGGNQQITAVLRSLAEQGDVRVLSSPQVSALNNQRAIFNVTTDEVIFTVSRQPIIGPNGTTIGFSNEIQTNQIAVGIVLDVFPQIAADNTVSMNIRPAITSVARVESIRTEDGSEARAPVIDRREIDSLARVRPGETIVIGGLMQTRTERRRSGIPLLKDLPVLGYLFGRVTEQETRGELVIFITPTIVSGQLREGG